MKQVLLFGFSMLLAVSGHAQAGHGDSILVSAKSKKYLAPTAENERYLNFYANRKYSYGFSETFYGFQSNTTIFHAIEGLGSDRLSWLDLDHWASFEATLGASFQPYQGFRFHLGFDYELLTPTKVHFYAGIQGAIGMKQNTLATDSKSSVMVGYHVYLVPFGGMMYWPGKRVIEKIDTSNYDEKSKLRNPTFWQLVFIKAQAGYSALVTPLRVNPSETFDVPTANRIRRNVSSGLYLSIGLGINLPTFKGVKLIDLKMLDQLSVE